MAYSFSFIYYTKFLYKIDQAAKQANKLVIYFKQAKQVSSRCQKLQAGKLRLLNLSCLLITNSGDNHVVLIELSMEDSKTM